MKCIKSLLILSVSTFVLAEQPAQVQKKKIAIAWCSGGGAHRAMLDALKSEFYLGKSYDIVPFNIFEDALYTMDPVRMLTFHSMNCQDFYNYLLARSNWLTNKLYYFGLRMFKRKHKRITAHFENYLMQTKPDLLISVMCLLNYELATAAARLKIPFLLIAPDLNLQNYFTFQPASSYWTTILFNDKLGWQTAFESGFKKENIKATGFPLRPDFFEKKDVAKIRIKFNVPANKPAIMLLMGGTGSSKMLPYIRKLATLEVPAHIIACIGKNTGIEGRLRRIKLPPHLSLSIVGFTDQISDLMAISHILITKPGPATICEAIQMQLPLVLDKTTTVLELEKLHLVFVKNNVLGDIVERFKDIKQQVTKLLIDKQYHRTIRNNMAAFDNRQFVHKIQQLTAEILHEKT